MTIPAIEKISSADVTKHTALATLQRLKAGDRVRVTQRVVAHDRKYLTTVEGVVVSVGARKTGSWFAHGKQQRLWLPRLVIRKADGELTSLVIDPHSVIAILPANA